LKILYSSNICDKIKDDENYKMKKIELKGANGRPIMFKGTISRLWENSFSLFPDLKGMKISLKHLAAEDQKIEDYVADFQQAFNQFQISRQETGNQFKVSSR